MRQKDYLELTYFAADSVLSELSGISRVPALLVFQS